jgi:hypothetical protein
VLAADEAVVLLQFVVAGFVALGLGLAWHGSDSNARAWFWLHSLDSHFSRKTREMG